MVTVARITSKIEQALKNSLNPRLKKMSFVKLSRGGASPVLKRRSSMSRFTVEQRAIIDATVHKFLNKNKHISNSEIREACLKQLAKKGLQENVLFELTAIRASKARVIQALKKQALVNSKRRQRARSSKRRIRVA